MSPAYSHVLARLATGVVLVLVALGGGGLAVAADGAQTDERRPELTARGDGEFEAWRARMAEPLGWMNASLDALSGVGREVLGRLYAQDLSGADELIARGDEHVGELDAARSALLAIRLEQAEALPAQRLGTASRGHLAAVDEAIEALREVPAAWNWLRDAAQTAGQLVAVLRDHDEAVIDATAAGRIGRWADALASLTEARTALERAQTIRGRLADVSDVTTLDSLLARYDAYGEALTELYAALDEGAASDGPEVTGLRAEVAAAQAALPTDNSALTIVVADAVGPSVVEALVAIEGARGMVTALLGGGEDEELEEPGESRAEDDEE